MLANLFINFLKIGLLSFGGGYSVISLIQSEIVTNYNLLTNEQFIDLLALSQISPGPVAINASTYVGLKLFGVIGSIISTIGVVILPILICIVIAKYYNKNKESILINDIVSIIKPCVVPIIFLSVTKLLPVSFVDYKSYIIFFIIGVTIFLRKVSPIMLIVFGAVLGIIL